MAHALMVALAVVMRYVLVGRVLQARLSDGHGPVESLMLDRLHNGLAVGLREGHTR